MHFSWDDPGTANPKYPEELNWSDRRRRRIANCQTVMRVQLGDRDGVSVAVAVEDGDGESPARWRRCDLL